METIDTPMTIMQRALQLIDDATAAGVIVTIRTEPKKPLAMGNYQMVAAVRASAASYRGKDAPAPGLREFVPPAPLFSEIRDKIESDMMTVDAERARRHFAGEAKP